MLFLTEGLLLRQMERDSLLQQYNVIILDEVHERHLSSDLLIGLLRELTVTRQDLKLIIMSATINLELFKEYFHGAPVVQVPGRLFPIQLRYHPIRQYIAENEKKSHKIDPEPYIRILEVNPVAVTYFTTLQRLHQEFIIRCDGCPSALFLFFSSFSKDFVCQTIPHPAPVPSGKAK
ncbi:unnamed protein product [Heligmosomoides polygyrus]|uniref:Helicase ATP-binding domain-containing protein n=1 Tax=Heligmosomoides polygyrus TaxID=6339 RepID=A0A3P8DQY8_HELPZ|nr:unnamed protein product [Heligmosomoides polygyrus]